MAIDTTRRVSRKVQEEIRRGDLDITVPGRVSIPTNRFSHTSYLNINIPPFATQSPAEGSNRLLTHQDIVRRAHWTSSIQTGALSQSVPFMDSTRGPSPITASTQRHVTRDISVVPSAISHHLPIIGESNTKKSAEYYKVDRDIKPSGIAQHCLSPYSASQKFASPTEVFLRPASSFPPGYSGHVPAIASNNVYGQTFGTSVKIAQEVLGSKASNHSFTSKGTLMSTRPW